MGDLTEELKKQIALELNLTHELDAVQPDTPLYKNSIYSLDSMDSLRIIVMLEKKYGIKIHDITKARKTLSSLNAIADFIEKNKQTEGR